MYNSIGKQKYIYLPRCSCVGRTQTSTTLSFQTLAQKRSPSHNKFLVLHSKFTLRNGGGPGNILKHPDMKFEGDLNFLSFWVLHSKKQ